MQNRKPKQLDHLTAMEGSDYFDDSLENHAAAATNSNDERCIGSMPTNKSPDGDQDHQQDSTASPSSTSSQWQSMNAKKTNAPWPGFLRAVRSFQPNDSIVSANGAAATAIRMSKGDIIFAEVVHTNGWAHGISLNSRAVGWFPPNHCRMYANSNVDAVLDAFVKLMQSREDADGVQARVQVSNEARQMTAAVRLLLQRTGCAQRESALNLRDGGVFRARESLLSKLEFFHYAAGRVTVAQTHAHAHAHAHEQDPPAELLRDALLGAMGVVVAATAFCDAWQKRATLACLPLLDHGGLSTRSCAKVVCKRGEKDADAGTKGRAGSEGGRGVVGLEPGPASAAAAPLRQNSFSDAPVIMMPTATQASTPFNVRGPMEEQRRENPKGGEAPRYRTMARQGDFRRREEDVVVVSFRGVCGHGNDEEQESTEEEEKDDDDDDADDDEDGDGDGDGDGSGGTEHNRTDTTSTNAATAAAQCGADEEEEEEPGPRPAPAPAPAASRPGCTRPEPGLAPPALPLRPGPGPGPGLVYPATTSPVDAIGGDPLPTTAGTTTATTTASSTSTGCCSCCSSTSTTTTTTTDASPAGPAAPPTSPASTPAAPPAAPPASAASARQAPFPPHAAPPPQPPPPPPWRRRPSPSPSPSPDFPLLPSAIIGLHHNNMPLPSLDFFSPTGPAAADLIVIPPSSSASSSSTSPSSTSSTTAAAAAAASTSTRYALASFALVTAFDSLVPTLDSFIVPSRSLMDLLETTHQSYACCQDLLSIINEVWERDCKRSASLDRARNDMQSNLEELGRVTRGICDDPNASFIPEHGLHPDRDEAILNIAARCVRSANDCLAETRAIIDRIGDFDVGPLDLRISGTFSRGPVTAASTSNTTRNGDNAALMRPTLLPSPLKVQLSSKASDTFSLPLPPVTSTLAASRLRSTRSAIFPTSSSYASRDVIPLNKNTSFSTLPRSPQSPTIDVEIPSTSSDDFFTTPRSLSSPPAKRTRTSRELSVEDPARTRISSFRGSDTSMLSQASTRATSPDRSPTEIDRFSDHNMVQPEEDDVEVVEAELAGDMYSHELICNAEGQVRGGSLRALVEKLTSFTATPGALFVDTFYLSFRLFVTPRAFARSLLHRFECVEKNPKVADKVGLRIFNVFKTWLELHWKPESDMEALEEVQAFASGPFHDHRPMLSKRLMELAIRALDVQHRPAILRYMANLEAAKNGNNASISMGPLPLPSIDRHQLHLLRDVKHGGPKCSILDFDPLELARQITLIKSKFYCKIQPEELMEQAWRKSSAREKSRNVRTLTTLTTDLSNLVIDTILSYEDPKKRAAIIKQWVKVAKHARELCNYDSLKAILIALDTSTIHRLKKTWDLVSPRTMARLREIKPVMDASRNWSHLRNIMRDQKVPCLPSVSNYLSDLAFIDEGNTPDRLRPRQPFLLSAAQLDPFHRVINFEKYILTGRSIGEIKKFQVPFRLNPVVEMQEWLLNEFRRVREMEKKGEGEVGLEGMGSEGGFYLRSLKLEPRERSNGGGGGFALDAGVGQTGGNHHGGGASNGGASTGRGRMDFWSGGLHLPLMGHRGDR